ncbi:hypothetical protein BD309DRAFT_1011992 [Dichomitus squalens]|nr:hypothetical protein BD309DRAFT_1011992 [Dichomitus squalens]
MCLERREPELQTPDSNFGPPPHLQTRPVVGWWCRRGFEANGVEKNRKTRNEQRVLYCEEPPDHTATITSATSKTAQGLLSQRGSSRWVISYSTRLVGLVKQGEVEPAGAAGDRREEKGSPMLIRSASRVTNASHPRSEIERCFANKIAVRSAQILFAPVWSLVGYGKDFCFGNRTLIRTPSVKAVLEFVAGKSTMLQRGFRHCRRFPGWANRGKQDFACFALQSFLQSTCFVDAAAPSGQNGTQGVKDLLNLDLSGPDYTRLCVS